MPLNEIPEFFHPEIRQLIDFALDAPSNQPHPDASTSKKYEKFDRNQTQQARLGDPVFGHMELSVVPV